MNFLFSNAYAQEATAQAAQEPNMLMQFAPLIAIFFIFYFLMIKPQQKKMKEEQAFIQALKKGDEVFTKSGMLGVVSGITEQVVTLELDGGYKVKFLKGQIGGSAKEILQGK
jgi:preprotein translocase subunit YajC